MFQVALSHDVDRTLKTYQTFSHGAKSLGKLDFKTFLFHLKTFYDKEVYWNFEDIIDIENSFGVKSTFYILNESIPFNLFDIKNWKLSLGRYNIQEERIVEMIRFLDANGWEIGVHGSYLSYKNLELLKSEKKQLELLLGKEVVGIRQHYLNLDDKTWSLQKEAGFKYDSSFGYTRDIGFKEEKVAPFKPFGDDFTVYPLVIMDSCFANKKDNWEYLDIIVNQAIENNGIVTINWHNNNYNSIEYPMYRQNYIDLIKYLLDKGGNFATLKEIYSNGK
uniref:polysaccharide deacetylase family protein n=2 Tax=Flavobacterium sp. TaxID=239 RepID=UPI00404A7E49